MQLKYDYLLQGPCFTNSLLGVLCRFRMGFYAFTCDIVRMYHQFRVNREFRDFLRFLWVDTDNKVRTYHMKVHIFGASSSPGCATFGLRKLAQDYSKTCKEASDFVLNNFYVDDGLLSSDSREEIERIICHSRQLCSLGNLELHRFVINDQNISVDAKCENKIPGNPVNLSLEDPTIERVLGIQWCVDLDTIQFRIVLKDSPLTRRGILSTVASIYDPLGFLAPFTLIGKQILQRMCQQNLGWDEPVNESIRTQWQAWRDEICKLKELSIPRCYKPKGFGKVVSQQLHHFSDASTSGYGQCSYIRQIDEDNKVSVALVMGKARVTPTKVTTVPRLELQAAVLSARTSKFLSAQLSIPNTQEYFWTDSRVVLGYIHNDVKRFKIYVANRIQEIRNLCSVNNWNHVEGKSNPADMASRGTRVNELMSSEWYTGPQQLYNRELSISTRNFPLAADDPKVKVEVLLIQQCHTFCDTNLLYKHFSRFSSWN